MYKLDDIKTFLEESEYKDYFIFNTAGAITDPISKIYDKDGVTIWVCERYEYLEIFGISYDDFKIIALRSLNKLKQIP